MNNSLSTLTLQTPEMAQANLERKNQIAVRHGLPAKGTRFRNQYGMEWVVDGHLFAPDFTSFARNGGDINPKDITEADPRDLMPAVVPLNWSRHLEEFYFLIDRCTSKHLMFLDTLPDLRPQQAKRDSHYVSFASDPARFLIHLDVERAHETIIAHELGHLWLALVEDCEDVRDLPADPHNIGKRFQFDYVNSFVTDQRVNEIIAERGFDVTFIDEQQREALILFSLAVEKGHRPSQIREAAFMALPIASVLLEKQKGFPDSRRRPDPTLDEALRVLKTGLPDVWVLAEQLADTVLQHGYSTSQSIRRSVEECLKLSFQFTGDDFDPARDLREGQLTEPNFDKWPQMLPGMPVEGKLEIGKLMAKHNLGAGGCRLSYTPLGQVQIEFVDEGGQVTSPIVLKHTHHIPDAPLPLPLDHLALQPVKKPHIPMPHHAAQRPQIPVSPRAPQMPRPQMPQVPMPQPPGAKAPIVPRLPNGQAIPGLPAIPGVTVPFPHQVAPTPNQATWKPQPQPFHPQPPHPHRRDYLPGLALSLAKERLGLEGDNNLYRYAGNNPVNRIDPSGLRDTDDPRFETPSSRREREQREAALAEDARIRRQRLSYNFDRYGRECYINCIAAHYGLTAAAAAMIYAGQPIPGSKRFVTENSSRGSSIASMELSKRFPQAFPNRSRPWAPTAKYPFARSPIVGRVAGRWVPWIGWGLALADVVAINSCANSCIYARTCEEPIG